MRFFMAQQGHFVNALPPIDVSGGATSDRWSMAKHSHASIVVAVGVSAAALSSIVLQASTDAAGNGAEAIGFDYFEETTAAGDTLSAKKTATATGITSPSANDNIFYVLEVEADQLPEGKPFLAVVLNNASGNSVVAAVGAVLSGARYQHDQNETVLA